MERSSRRRHLHRLELRNVSSRYDPSMLIQSRRSSTYRNSLSRRIEKSQTQKRLPTDLLTVRWRNKQINRHLHRRWTQQKFTLIQRRNQPPQLRTDSPLGRQTTALPRSPPQKHKKNPWTSHLHRQEHQNNSQLRKRIRKDVTSRSKS